jgi:nucleoside-diphosphate-sugar epimerase
MNILITGIHGFVGSSLVEAFKGEHLIYGLDNVTSAMESVEKTFTYAEMKHIPEVDVVIHLAGKSIDTNELSKVLEYFENNAGLTKCVFDWFLHSKAGMFVYMSSVKAAANEVKGLPLTEDMEPKPFGALGESKLLAEQYILSQWSGSKKVYVFRPAFMYCGLVNVNLKRMYNWVKDGWPYPFGQFECRRSFTSMGNLNFVLKQMFEKNIPGGIYNISDDGTLRACEVFELIGRVLNKKARIWHLNKYLLRFIARIGTKWHGRFNLHEYRKLNCNFVVSNDKIKQALGIEKMPVSTVDGLTDSILGFSKK